MMMTLIANPAEDELRVGWSPSGTPISVKIRLAMGTETR